MLIMQIEHWVMAHETYIRLGFFLGILGAIGLLELLYPKRVLTGRKSVRWLNNLGLVVLNSLLLRLIFPAAAVGMSVFVVNRGGGLLSLFDIPGWFAIGISILALDLVIYLQHVLFHAVPILWRLHRVHHADPDFDVTTGARFHPLEILLSMVIKFSAIMILGPPILAVVLFEIVLNATAMFNHGNISLPNRLDQLLRWVVVTPDMHRVHHSVEMDEANSNFGFNLPWWDRLFGTYRDQPRGGHRQMTIGIHGYRLEKDVSWMPGLLWLPFRSKSVEYSINRHKPDTIDA